VTTLAMADLDTALSTSRESLLADVSMVTAASPAGSAQDAPRRGSPADRGKSRGKRRARRHRRPSPSSSSTSSLPSMATTNDEEDRVNTKASYEKLAVREFPDDPFAGVLDYRSYGLRNPHSTNRASHTRKMGQTAMNMKLFFRGTPMFNGKEPLTVFLWLRKFFKACDDKDVSEGMGL